MIESKPAEHNPPDIYSQLAIINHVKIMSIAPEEIRKSSLGESITFINQAVRQATQELKIISAESELLKHLQKIQPFALILNQLMCLPELDSLLRAQIVDVMVELYLQAKALGYGESAIVKNLSELEGKATDFFSSGRDEITEQAMLQLGRFLEEVLTPTKREIRPFPEPSSSHLHFPSEREKSSEIYLKLAFHRGNQVKRTFNSTLPQGAAAKQAMADLVASFICDRLVEPLYQQVHAASMDEQVTLEAALLNVMDVYQELQLSGNSSALLCWIGRLVPRLLGIYWDEDQGLAPFEELLEAVAQLATQTFEAYVPLSDELQEIQLEQMVWFQLRARLEAHRTRLHDSLRDCENQEGQNAQAGRRSALIEFNEALVGQEGFVANLFAYCQHLLGQSPIEFTVLLLGSGSCRQMTAYSDIESALLIADKNHLAEQLHKKRSEGLIKHTHFLTLPIETVLSGKAKSQALYLRHLWEVFEFYLASLGENETGLHLDKACQPRKEGFCGALKQVLFECQKDEIKADDGLVYSMLHADFLGGSQLLFERYRDKLHRLLKKYPTLQNGHHYQASQNTEFNLLQPGASINQPWHRYWALSQLKKNQGVYQELMSTLNDTDFELLDAIDLKKPYTKLLKFMLLDCALYHLLPDKDLTTAGRALVEGGYLSQTFVERVGIEIDWLNAERSEQHFRKGVQLDKILASDRSQEAWTTLQRRLKYIVNTLLSPFYGQLEVWFKEGFPAFSQRLWLAETQHRLQQWDHESQTLQHEDYRLHLQLFDPHGIVEPGIRFALPPAWTDAILDETGQLKSQHDQGNSFVTHYAGWCLKIMEPDENDPLTQAESLITWCAREQATLSLSHLLQAHTIPQGCAGELFLTRKTPKGNQEIRYAVWLARWVEGQTLWTFEQQCLEKGEDLFLDYTVLPSAFASLFLLNLLIYPEDWHPRNFVVAQHHRTELPLFSVDNKRTFVRPFESIRSLFSLTAKPTLKSILYLLPDMSGRFPLPAREQLLALDASALSRRFEHALLDFDRLLIEHGFTFSEAQPPFQALDFSPVFLCWPSIRIQQIQDLLRESPLLNYRTLFRLLQPQSAEHYQTRLQAYTQSRSRNFTAFFYDQFAENYHPWRGPAPDEFGSRLGVPKTLAYYSSRTARSKIQRYGRISLGQLKEAGFELTSWVSTLKIATLSESAQQVCLFFIQQSAPQLISLNFAHCKLVTDDDINGILSRVNPELLLHIDLSGCTQLTVRSWGYISDYCPQLQTLRLRGCVNIFTGNSMRSQPLSQLVLLDLREVEFGVSHNLRQRLLSTLSASELTELSIEDLALFSGHQLEPGLYETHHASGLRYYQAKQFDQALIAFNKAIDLLPDCVYLYHSRLLCQLAREEVSVSSWIEDGVQVLNHLTLTDAQRYASQLFIQISLSSLSLEATWRTILLEAPLPHRWTLLSAMLRAAKADMDESSRVKQMTPTILDELFALESWLTEIPHKQGIHDYLLGCISEHRLRPYDIQLIETLSLTFPRKETGQLILLSITHEEEAVRLFGLHGLECFYPDILPTQRAPILLACLRGVKLESASDKEITAIQNLLGLFLHLEEWISGILKKQAIYDYILACIAENDLNRYDLQLLALLSLELSREESGQLTLESLYNSVLPADRVNILLTCLQSAGTESGWREEEAAANQKLLELLLNLKEWLAEIPNKQVFHVYILSRIAEDNLSRYDLRLIEVLEVNFFSRKERGQLIRVCLSHEVGGFRLFAIHLLRRSYPIILPKDRSSILLACLRCVKAGSPLDKDVKACQRLLTTLFDLDYWVPEMPDKQPIKDYILACTLESDLGEYDLRLMEILSLEFSTKQTMRFIQGTADERWLVLSGCLRSAKVGGAEEVEASQKILDTLFGLDDWVSAISEQQAAYEYLLACVSENDWGKYDLRLMKALSPEFSSEQTTQLIQVQLENSNNPLYLNGVRLLGQFYRKITGDNRWALLLGCLRWAKTGPSRQEKVEACQKVLDALFGLDDWIPEITDKQAAYEYLLTCVLESNVDACALRLMEVLSPEFSSEQITQLIQAQLESSNSSLCLNGVRLLEQFYEELPPESQWPVLLSCLRCVKAGNSWDKKVEASQKVLDILFDSKIWLAEIIDKQAAYEYLSTCVLESEVSVYDLHLMEVWVPELSSKQFTQLIQAQLESSNSSLCLNGVRLLEQFYEELPPESQWPVLLSCLRCVKAGNSWDKKVKVSQKVLDILFDSKVWLAEIIDKKKAAYEYLLTCVLENDWGKHDLRLMEVLSPEFSSKQFTQLIQAQLESSNSSLCLNGVRLLEQFYEELPPESQWPVLLSCLRCVKAGNSWDKKVKASQKVLDILFDSKVWLAEIVDKKKAVCDYLLACAWEGSLQGYDLHLVKALSLTLSSEEIRPLIQAIPELLESSRTTKCLGGLCLLSRLYGQVLPEDRWAILQECLRCAETGYTWKRYAKVNRGALSTLLGIDDWIIALSAKEIAQLIQGLLESNNADLHSIGIGLLEQFYRRIDPEDRFLLLQGCLHCAKNGEPEDVKASNRLLDTLLNLEDWGYESFDPQQFLDYFIKGIKENNLISKDFLFFQYLDINFSALDLETMLLHLCQQPNVCVETCMVFAKMVAQNMTDQELSIFSNIMLSKLIEDKKIGFQTVTILLSILGKRLTEDEAEAFLPYLIENLSHDDHQVRAISASGLLGLSPSISGQTAQLWVNHFYERLTSQHSKVFRSGFLGLQALYAWVPDHQRLDTWLLLCEALHTLCDDDDAIMPLLLRVGDWLPESSIPRYLEEILASDCSGPFALPLLTPKLSKKIALVDMPLFIDIFLSFWKRWGFYNELAYCWTTFVKAYTDFSEHYMTGSKIQSNLDWLERDASWLCEIEPTFEFSYLMSGFFILIDKLSFDQIQTIIENLKAFVSSSFWDDLDESHKQAISPMIEGFLDSTQSENQAIRLISFAGIMIFSGQLDRKLIKGIRDFFVSRLPEQDPMSLLMWLQVFEHLLPNILAFHLFESMEDTILSGLQAVEDECMVESVHNMLDRLREEREALEQRDTESDISYGGFFRGSDSLISEEESDVVEGISIAILEDDENLTYADSSSGELTHLNGSSMSY